MRGGAIELAGIPAGWVLSAEGGGATSDQARPVDHREAIRVSWFASAGALASDRPGRGEAEIDTFADDVWTTPDAGPAHLWVVLAAAWRSPATP